MFTGDGFFWGVISGAICASMVTVLFFRMWEAKDAKARDRRTKWPTETPNHPQEHDERLG